MLDLNAEGGLAGGHQAGDTAHPRRISPRGWGRPQECGVGHWVNHDCVLLCQFQFFYRFAHFFDFASLWGPAAGGIVNQHMSISGGGFCNAS